MLILVVVALTAYVWTRMGSPLRVATDRIPTLLPGAIALAVAAVLNTALNDSGITIAGMMLAIAGAAIVYISVAFLDETSGTTTRRTIDRAPEPAPSADGSDRVPTSTDA